MRDFKFRGYGKNENKWLFGSIAITEHSYAILTVNNEKGSIEGDMTCYPVIKESIGEYTGLKDINGVDIYEGDIVLFDIYNDRSEIITGYIEYCPPRFDFCYYEPDCKTMDFNGDCNDFYIEQMSLTTLCKLEVIGNIYENPELMEIKKC